MRARGTSLGATGFALVCGLALAQAGCSSDVQAGRELNGSASDGLVFVLPDLDDVDRTDLWRARLSDGAVRPFMETIERDETWPFWSAAAGMLVFEASPVEPDGRPTQQLLLWSDGEERDLPGVLARHEAWAAWAATSSRLVYVFTALRRPPVPNGIAVVDVDKGEQRILARGGPERVYIRPELDPQGLRVVAQQTARPSSPEDRRKSEVWLLQLGASLYALTSEDVYADKARFTRDGRYVVLTRRPAPRAPGDLVLMRPDGSDERVLASTPDSDDHTARGSPVRDEIVFVSDRDGKHDLFLVDLAGGEPRNLTAELDLEVSAPRWSPDGERIVATTNPYDPDAPRNRGRRVTREVAHLIVVNRMGRLLLKTRGFSADWMPPWKGPAGSG